MNSKFAIFDHFSLNFDYFRPEMKKIRRNYSEAEVINGKIKCNEPNCKLPILSKNLERHYTNAHEGFTVDWVL